MRKLLNLVLFLGFIFQSYSNSNLGLEEKSNQEIQNKKDLGALIGFCSGAGAIEFVSFLVQKKNFLDTTLAEVAFGFIGAIVGYNIPRGQKSKKSYGLKEVANEDGVQKTIDQDNLAQCTCTCDQDEKFKNLCSSVKFNTTQEKLRFDKMFKLIEAGKLDEAKALIPSFSNPAQRVTARIICNTKENKLYLENLPEEEFICLVRSLLRSNDNEEFKKTLTEYVDEAVNRLKCNPGFESELEVYKKSIMEFNEDAWIKSLGVEIDFDELFFLDIAWIHYKRHDYKISLNMI